jgi:Mce-associated membrane protein
VRDKAPAQKLVLTTTVVSSAVQSLEGDRARVLAFLDQSATRADTGATNAAAAQLSVTVKREGGHWVITDMAPR